MNAWQFRQGLLRPLVCGLILLCAGCSTVAYIAQSAGGQLNVLMRSQAIDSLLNDSSTPPELIRQLSLIKQIRRFAVAELMLPENESYTRYADVQREYVVWNVFATEEFSVEPLTWCFPIAGCVAYRGYFDKNNAVKYATKLDNKGLDTFIGGVPAYSTLGWFDDPVLNTVINYPEAELAGLIFHELAHQIVYVKDDTTFNESFATAVELEGVKRWLALQNDNQGYTAYRQNKKREDEVIKLILDFRGQLKSLYEQNMPISVKHERKTALFQSLPDIYADLRKNWPDDVRYDDWFDQQWNNAYLIPFSAYYDYVPGFQRLIREANGEMERFYQQVKRLANVDIQARETILSNQLPTKE